MNTDSAESSQASALASMLDATYLPQRVWRDDELASVLLHQLAAPLSSDLPTMRGVTPDHVDALADAAVPPIHSFADLLHHPAPPLELLELTKRFAKRARSARGASVTLPKEVAAVLYFGAIHAARDKCDTPISNLSDEEVRAGISWVLAQPWVNSATRALLTPPS